MRYLMVRHKVLDYPKWREVFDSHASAQRDAGLTVLHVLRNTDDPDELWLLFQADSIEKARAFVSSPDVPRAMRESGVIDQPDIYFLT